MRFWIAAFLISLFAFQVLPVTVLGKSCIKAKVLAGESSEDESGDEDAPLPEPGKIKKNGGALEDFCLGPAQQLHFRVEAICSLRLSPPELAVTAASGHTRLHTPPPDRY